MSSFFLWVKAKTDNKNYLHKYVKFEIEGVFKAYVEKIFQPKEKEKILLQVGLTGSFEVNTHRHTHTNT